MGQAPTAGGQVGGARGAPRPSSCIAAPTLGSSTGAVPCDEAGGAGSLQDDRQATVWPTGPTLEPAVAVAEAIDRFDRSRLPTEQWARIEPGVRAAVEAATPTSVYAARDLLNVVVQLASWADTTGQSTKSEVLFHPDVIDRFVTEGCAHLAEGTRLNYRRNLRDVGAAVLGASLYPPRPLPLVREDISEPYTEKELSALLAWCRGLPTAHMRENALGIIALGRGAGLSHQEMARLVGTDVAVDADGVVVSVLGRNPRNVPVLGSWGPLVAARAADVEERPFLLPERTRIVRHHLSNFILKCPRGDAPRLDTRRLRASWIVEHLGRGTHLAALAEAAGVTPAQAVKYLRFVEGLDPAEARRQLHGACT